MRGHSARGDPCQRSAGGRKAAESCVHGEGEARCVRPDAAEADYQVGRSWLQR